MSVLKHDFRSIAVFIETIHAPIASLVFTSLDLTVVFTKLTLEIDTISVRVKTVNFVIANVNNLCKNPLLSKIVDFLDGKETLVVLFKTKR